MTGVNPPKKDESRNNREDSLRAADVMYVQDLWRKSAEAAQAVMLVVIVLVALSLRGAGWHVKRVFVVLLIYFLTLYQGVEAEEEFFMRRDPERRNPRSWPRRHVTLNTIGDCLGTTRFNKEDLYILLRVLNIPPQLLIKGSHFSGEECLLIFLHKFALDPTLSSMAKDVYGGSDTLIGDAYHYMLNYIYLNFAIQLCTTGHAW